MKKIIVAFVCCSLFTIAANSQPVASKEQQDLERQRQELKREMEQTQQLLDNNKKTTRENLTTLTQINRKLGLQEKMLDNINREISLMDNNIYKSQKDVNRYQQTLDTLKEEYKKSMVYSYKNRSNSDFLNFIFSSSSFNDAIKRITYLKSYRNYREMQGENILRTQALLKSRIEELSGSKQKKNVVLQMQSKEVTVLEKQQEEKNEIVSKLKAQGKELSNQLAAKKKQMLKVNNAFAAAIKRANDEAKKLAKAAADRERKEEANAAKNNTVITNTKTVKKVKAVAEPPNNTKSVFLGTDALISLNASFERNRGNLPWPVNSGYPLLHFGLNKLGNGVEVNSDCISIGCDVGTPVKAIFEGEVTMIDNYDDLQLVVIKHGKYFTGYSNISGVNLKKGQTVTLGQVIGKVAANLDGVGAVDFRISNDRGEMNPEVWLKRR